MHFEKPTDGEKPKVIQVSITDRTIWLPDANRGIAVLGGTGSGKTYGVIDPAIRSAIDQGFPIILYDYKYAEQSSRIAGIAADAGYKVSIFAPSFPESGICNPLDFIRDATDVDMARQVAIGEKTFCGLTNYSSSPEIEAKIFKISAALMSLRSLFE